MHYFETLPRPTKKYHTKPYDRIVKDHKFTGQGKTVVITGGASGVGYNISKAFAEAGTSRIVIISRSAEPQRKTKAELETKYPGTEVLAFQASITDHEALRKIIIDLGRVDVVVLNAAVAHGRTAASDLKLSEVNDAFETNVIAAFNACQAFCSLPPPPSGDRTIINVSAAAAHMISPYRAAYGASKAASIQLMQAIASQFVGKGVKVFSFHPGSFYTPGVAANMPRSFPGIEWEDEGLPAWFSVWLAGGDSSFLSGSFLWAHWDVEEMMALKDKLAADPNYLTIGLIQ